MSKARLFFIIGIWVAILPYLGFPYSWKMILTTLSGLAIIYISYTLYRISKAKEKSPDNFTENKA